MSRDVLLCYSERLVYATDAFERVVSHYDRTTSLYRGIRAIASIGFHVHTAVHNGLVEGPIGFPYVKFLTEIGAGSINIVSSDKNEPRIEIRTKRSLILCLMSEVMEAAKNGVAFSIDIETLKVFSEVNGKLFETDRIQNIIL